MKNSLLLLFSLCVVTGLQSQSSSNCDRLHSLIQHGLYDQVKTQYDELSMIAFASWVDEQEFSSYSELKTKAQGIGFDVPGYFENAKWNDNGFKSFNNQNYRSYKELMTNSEEFRKSMVQESNVVNVEALKAIASCKENFSIWVISMSDDGSLVNLGVSIRPILEIPYPKITEIGGNYGVNHEIWSLNNEVLGKVLTIECSTISIQRTNPATPIQLDIKTSSPTYQGSILIPGFKQVNTPKPTPKYRYLDITYSYKTQNTNSSNSPDFVAYVETAIPIGGEWVSPISNFEERQCKVVVDVNGYYSLYTKSIHTGNEWSPLNGVSSEFNQIDTSSSSCMIRAKPAKSDELWQWEKTK